jgi:DNA-directed RNA polymerase alpha subunit
MNNCKDLDQFTIEELGLSLRSLNTLHRNGIFTVGTLNEFFKSGKLEMISLLGKKGLNDISDALKRFNVESYNCITKIKLDDTQTFSQDDYVRMYVVRAFGT